MGENVGVFFPIFFTYFYIECCAIINGIVYGSI